MVGYRKSDFGVTALVKRYRCTLDRVLDDIMLYSIKGKKAL